MRNLTVQQFMSEFALVQVNKLLKRNRNTYPFVTFIDGNNVATNVYFSKEAAKLLGEDVTEVTRELLENHTISIYPIPETGEEMIRLSRKGSGSSLRLDFCDLWG
jgi:hypothetical protein